MDNKIKHLVVYGIFLCGCLFAHPFHSSIVSLEFNNNSRSIEITMRVFANDLEKTINQIYNSNIVIDNDDNMRDIDSLIFNYINKTIFLSINEKECDLSWIGKEFETDIVWLYLEILDLDKKIKKIISENRFLFSSFEDQLNIMNFYIHGKQKTVMTHKDKPVDILSF
jgi:hypothetical protein